MTYIVLLEMFNPAVSYPIKSLYSIAHYLKANIDRQSP